MGQAIGELLPSAVGVAISPVPVIAVILMLSTSRARVNGAAFALGWVAGLVVVSALVLLLADDGASSGSTSTAISIAKLAFGVLFILMAVRQWRGRPAPGTEAALPAWMASIDQFTGRKSLLLGAALSAANPKNLALTVAATASISQAGLAGAQSAAAAAVFVVVGSLSVAGPVAFYLIATDRAREPLDSMKQFMAEHNAAIMTVVLLVLGAKLIGNGIAGVTGP